MLYVDLPTQPELRNLAAARNDPSVSIYLATTPQTQHIDQARLQLGHLLKQAEDQLEAAGTPKRSIWPISEQVADLIDDDEFWRFQANSLALLITPDRLRSYRLPTRLGDNVHTADRFLIGPLMRATSVQQHAFVLALEENQVRLFEIFADLPGQEIRVPGMPKDAASAIGVASVNARAASGSQRGTEGQKMRLRQYVRIVDAALRPIMAGRDEPLILAATEPLAPMFRELNSYPELVAEGITASPAHMSESDITVAARPILDRLHNAHLRELGDLFAARRGDGRAVTDPSHAARAATFGAIDTLLVDINAKLPGHVDETTGAITFSETEKATNLDILDEIAGRVIANGGKVYGVRAEDMPDNAQLAAILRFAI